MFELTTTYSLWWLLPIVILSAMLSFLLYFKNTKDEFPNWLKVLLFSTRFFTFVILASLLLSPMLKSWKTEIEKPVIILAIDNSNSMVLSGDTISNIANNKEVIANVVEGLNGKYQVDYYTFGDETKSSSAPDFQDKYTDLSQCISQINQKYAYRNVGAMVVLSDGIYNRGNNPIYESALLSFPIYTLGFGDSSIYPDMAISRVLYNKSVFIENTFPIEVSVLAKNRKNTLSRVSLFHGSKLISSKEIQVESDNQLLKVLFEVKAQQSGLQSYRIVVQSFEGELNTINNLKTINIDVIGEKKKVILLYSAPNPDIAALKQVFENSDEYKLEVKLLQDFNNNLKDYNLAIFYQFPNANRQSFNLIKQAKVDGIPFMVILGTQTDLQRFNSLNLGIIINAKSNSIIEATSILNTEFSDFIIPKSIKEQLQEFPPLFVPFGKYDYSNYVHTIVYQRLGLVNTQYPLISISEQNAYRNAFIFGEGIWKWRMMDFLKNKQHNAFDDFVMKLIRYISLTKSYQQFDVQYKRRVSQIEPIEFYAVLLNESYEKVIDADIQMIIKNEKGDEFPFAFNKYGDGFKLNAGQFPQGIYNFVASVNYNGKYMESKGSFVVDAIQLEAINLQADFDILRKISTKSGGEFYVQKDNEKLISQISNKEDIVNIQRQNMQFKELVKFPWLWVLVVLLMSAEWFLRKQMGSY